MAKFIFDKKNILIMGGAGFIGSHLADQLAAGNKVICVDNLSSGSERNIDHLLANPNFKFIKHDLALPLVLEDYTELADFRLEFQGVQEIYNLACPTSPKYFDRNRIATLLANSYVVKNGLDLALKYQAKFMHLSSSVVYGERRVSHHHMVETEIGLVDQLSPRSSYDEGKRFAETMVANYRDVYKLDVRIARLFRIYGPRMLLNDGQMIPDFINNALDNKDLVIYGDQDFATGLCYVTDCVSGLLKLMDSQLTAPINFGSDIDWRLADVAQKVIDKTNSQSKIIFEQPLLFMTPLPVPDISRAREELSWMPLVTLDDGLDKTIRDLRASKGLKGLEGVAY